MGRDKANLRLGGRTLVGNIRATSRQLGFPVRVIRRDLVKRCGPLGGVYTALKTTNAAAVLFLSCDMPFVSAELIDRVVTKLSARRKAVFVIASELIGFPFVLRRETLPVVEAQLKARQFSVHALARKLNATVMRLPPRHRHELFNINTRADWSHARELWRRLNNKHPQGWRR